MKIRGLIGLFICAVFLVGNTFAQNTRKAAYVILLDNTGTLRTQLDAVKKVGKEVVRQVNSQGIISAFSFSTKELEKTQIAEPTMGIDWGQDAKTFEKYIDGLSTVGGQTALVDAIRSSAESLNTRVNVDSDGFSEKIVVIITDGEDRASQTKPKELINFLKEHQIKVFAIGLVEALSGDAGFVGASPQVKSKDFLKKITKETGGRVIFPQAKQTVEDAVKDLFAQNTTGSK